MIDPVTSDATRWRKSSYSSAGNCVEIAELPDGRIGIRNSNHPSEAATVFTRSEIDAFLRGAKSGEFDDMG